VLADLDVEQHAKSFHRGTSPPVVSHQISAESIDQFNAEFFTRAAASDPLRAGTARKPSAE
jgi:hypothetical protein